MNRENYCIDNEGVVTICDGLHDGDNCEYRPIRASEMLSLVKRAALFNWLAARSFEWHPDIQTLYVRDSEGGILGFAAPTLAEAIEAALAAEGGAK